MTKLLDQEVFYCIEMYVALFIYMSQLKKREHFFLRYIFGIAGLSACVLLNKYVLHTGVIWFIVMFCAMIIICYACCEVQIGEAAYCSATAYLSQHVASSLLILISRNGQAPESGGSLTYYLVFIGVYACSYFLFATKLCQDGHYVISKVNIAISVATTLMIVLFINIYIKKLIGGRGENIGDPIHLKLFLVSQLMDVFLCLLVLFMQLEQKREIDARMEKVQLYNMWKQRKNQYNMAKENVELINRKCHDLKHQIAVISENNDIKKEKFISEMQDLVEIYDITPNTGNETLDTILMEKGLYCRMNQIQWNCVADGKAIGFMDEVDLYTLLGNAIENAIEGVEKIEEIPKRIITIKIWKKNDFVLIRVDNSCQGKVVMKNGFPVTSKKDSVNHGIGTQSIRAIAEKYHGSAEFESSEEMFTLNILLPWTDEMQS